LREHYEWVGIWGFSAGGHLAALAALSNDSHVNAAVLGSAITDFTIPGGLVALDSDVTQLLFRGRNELAHEASPINHVRADAPPFLISHGTADDAVPFEHARHLHAALQSVGGYSELVTLAGADHGWQPTPGMMRFGELALDFFQRHLTTSRAPSQSRS